MRSAHIGMRFSQSSTCICHPGPDVQFHHDSAMLAALNHRSESSGVGIMMDRFCSLASACANTTKETHQRSVHESTERVFSNSLQCAMRVVLHVFASSAETCVPHDLNSGV
eukprot:1935166-Rhodomonas_salina.1